MNGQADFIEKFNDKLIFNITKKLRVSQSNKTKGVSE
jgi:hypothetical protein